MYTEIRFCEQFKTTKSNSNKKNNKQDIDTIYSKIFLDPILYIIIIIHYCILYYQLSKIANIQINIHLFTFLSLNIISVYSVIYNKQILKHLKS